MRPVARPPRAVLIFRSSVVIGFAQDSWPDVPRHGSRREPVRAGPPAGYGLHLPSVPASSVDEGGARADLALTVGCFSGPSGPSSCGSSARVEDDPGIPNIRAVKLRVPVCGSLRFCARSALSPPGARFELTCAVVCSRCLQRRYEDRTSVAPRQFSFPHCYRERPCSG